jgi:putative cardiolipin synthase
MITSRCNLRFFGWLHLVLATFIIALVSGCSSLPPGANYPKTASTALEHPETTKLGSQFQRTANLHDGNSGYRVIPAGVDGFLLRIQLINAAERTLDLQYFIFHGDETGRLLTEAVLHAADRGVRIRLLIDDGETVSGDEQISVLEAHPNIDIRIFNPFSYRGHVTLFRATEFMFNISRLDYRMHNKLFVVDNAIALIGGRNVADEYFQIDPQLQLADDDVFAAGPIVGLLSKTFDEFWNSDLAIPIQALSSQQATRADLNEHRADLSNEHRELKADGVDFVKRIASGEPFQAIIAGELPLIWAHAQVVYDSPDKKKVESGAMVGRLMQRPVADVAAAVQSELLMITPFLIPGQEGMHIFDDLHQRGVHVRILTNSLESSTQLAAHSGYVHFRVPLLNDGVELYEIRALLGNNRGSGETTAISRFGNYSLHAKLFVFDRTKLFIGSMNFDQRSMHLNTEIGLIIDSPELAQQVAARFNAMVQPTNAYQLVLHANDRSGTESLVWRTQEGGQTVQYDIEPARNAWQRLGVRLLSFLPWENEL